MTVTVFPSSTKFHDGTSPDLTLLNVSRLLARLEHNLLSPGADLKPLRRSEYQRMRVNANIEYARSLLVQLEQSLPQIKAPDRRHEIQTEITKRRQILKRVVDALDEISAETERRRDVAKREDTSRLRSVEMAAGKDTGRGHADDEKEEEMWSEEEGDEAEDLLATPEGDISVEVGQTGTAALQSQAMEIGMETETESGQEKLTPPSTATPTTTTTTTTSVSSDHDHDHEQSLEPTTTTLPTPQGSETIPPSSPTTTTQTSSVLRNRHALLSPTLRDLSAPPTTAATTTSSSTTTTTTAKLHSTEQTLSTHRLEQEDLTASLLTMASQLKASTQAFHTTIEGEKSTLARAAEGLDRTTSSMQAAERRMGMLRRMTEGKGWWGRMMLYAWIFGLWVLAVLIVFLGPKLRF